MAEGAREREARRVVPRDPPAGSIAAEVHPVGRAVAEGARGVEGAAPRVERAGCHLNRALTREGVGLPGDHVYHAPDRAVAVQDGGWPPQHFDALHHPWIERKGDGACADEQLVAVEELHHGSDPTKPARDHGPAAVPRVALHRDTDGAGLCVGDRLVTAIADRRARHDRDARGGVEGRQSQASSRQGRRAQRGGRDADDADSLAQPRQLQHDREGCRRCARGHVLAPPGKPGGVYAKRVRPDGQLVERKRPVRARARLDPAAARRRQRDSGVGDGGALWVSDAPRDTPRLRADDTCCEPEEHDASDEDTNRIHARSPPPCYRPRGECYWRCRCVLSEDFLNSL